MNPPTLPELDEIVGVEGLTHHTFRRDWGDQHVVTAGPEDGPALLLVHGWPEHWFAWRKVIAALATEARVVAVDLRGFGWSETTRARVARTSIADLASDLTLVLDSLDIKQATLAAHDWGGWIGFRAVLADPDRFSSYAALAIMPPWLSREPMRRNRLRGWGYVYLMAGGGQLIARWSRAVRAMIDFSTGEPVWNTPDGLIALASYLDRVGEHAAPRMTRHLYRSFVRAELPAALGPRPQELAMPTTVMVGSGERIAKVENWWARGYPGEIKVLTVPGANHWLAEEAPNQVIAELAAMLGVPSPVV